MHCRFSQPSDQLRRSAPFLHYDAAFYRLWLQRACEFVGQALTRRDPPSRALWERLVRNYDQVIQRLVALPATLIHGEFYASNVLVETSADGVRMCPVDWEMAALGPGLVDLAALTAGRWSDEDRSALAEAYLGGLRAAGAARAGLEELLASLDDCRLHVAMLWLGWSRDWTPPPEHAHDWLAEALMLGRKLGL
jgi:thiamine kinase-like enzyme